MLCMRLTPSIHIHMHSLDYSSFHSTHVIPWNQVSSESVNDPKHGCVYGWMGLQVHACMDRCMNEKLKILAKYRRLSYEWTCKQVNEQTWKNSVNFVYFACILCKAHISTYMDECMYLCVAMCRHMRDSTVGCCTETMTPSSSLTLSVSCCKTLTPACPTSSQVWFSK